MNLRNISVIKDGSMFLNAIKRGLSYLRKNETIINDLNVFPVPDGDTGTNMRITLEKGVENVSDINSISSILSSLATGALFGARGNSGVLLSQYIKGVSLYLEGLEEFDITQLSLALKAGYERAYSVTIKPEEGTILTVAREGIDNTIKKLNENTTLGEFLSLLCDNMRLSLDNTPNLLSVLKEHDVIDSGGKGLLTFFEGVLSFVEGKEETDEIYQSNNKQQSANYLAFNADSELDYGYCTEFILQLLNKKIQKNPFNLDSFITFLKNHGDSIVAFKEGDRVKVHIHTVKPSTVIDEAQKYGEFISFKMENMALQHNEQIIKKSNKRKDLSEFGIVSIATGTSLIEMFKKLGSDYVIDGGLTMNSSVTEILDACSFVNAKTIFLLPNNPNLILTAKQASELAKDFKIEVIETTSLQEGYMALQSTLKTLDIGSVRESLESSFKNVSSYFVGLSSKASLPNETLTYSVGDYLGGEKHNVLVAGKNKNEAMINLLHVIDDMDDKETIFILTGKDVSEDDVTILKEAIENDYPYLEVGFIKGDFPIYPYLLGVLE